MCAQRRFRFACALAQYDQSLSFPPEEMLDPWQPIERPSKTKIRVSAWRLCQLASFADNGSIIVISEARVLNHALVANF